MAKSILLGCFRMLVGSLVSGAIMSVGAVVIGLFNLPSAIGASYKALYNETRVGPYVKMAIGATIPVISVLSPVLLGLAGAGYGMFVGGSNGLITGIFKAVVEAFVEVKNFHVDMLKMLLIHSGIGNLILF